MKLSHTFKECLPDAQADMPIDVDIGFVIDHLPDKYVDYHKTRDELCAIHYGSNPLVEQGPNTAFVYEQYVDMAHAGNKLFVCETISHIQDIETGNAPVKEFKFSAWLNKPREHRIVLSSWLNENFTIDDNWEYTSSFNVEQEHITLHTLFIGDIYPGLPVRFTEELPRSKAVFNIITEPNFWELGHHWSAKSEECFLDYCIPIQHGYMACDSLQKLGFDMFVDILDYTSQTITDPYARTIQLMQDNREALDNAWDIWNMPGVQERVEQNHRLLVQLNSCIELLNTPEDIAFFKDIMYNTNNKELRTRLEYIFR